MSRRALAWLVPAAAVLAVGAAFLLGGPPRGTDWAIDLTRIVEMREALAGGQMPPFWAAAEYDGFGSPLFLFYAPLSPLVGAAIHALGFQVSTAAMLAGLLFVIVGALTMRAAAAEVGGVAAQRMAAVAMVLHPFLLGDLWFRNASAEVAALALLPGVIAGAVARDPRRRFVWTAASLAGVILAHNLTALVACALSLGLALLVQRGWRGTAPVLAGVAAALALTAFFWVPAVALKSLGVRDEALTSGMLDFHRRFPRPLSLLSLDTAKACYGGGLLGLTMLVTVLAAAFDLRGADDHRRRTVRACAAAAAVLLFLMLPLSAPVWEHVPLMRYFQFPWRFAGPLAVVAIVGCAAVVPAEPRRHLEVLAVLLAASSAAPMFAAYTPVPADELQAWSRLLTPDGIREHHLRSTVGDDFLPRAADLRVTSRGHEPVAAVTAEVVVHETSVRRGAARTQVTSPRGGTVAFRRWAFPVWHAAVDGVEVPTLTLEGGVVGVHVPPGDHAIELTPIEPPIRLAGIGLSASAAVVGLGVVLFRHRRRRATRKP